MLQVGTCRKVGSYHIDPVTVIVYGHDEPRYRKKGADCSSQKQWDHRVRTFNLYRHYDGGITYFLCICLMRDVLFYYPPFCVFYDQNKPLKREC